MRPLAVSTKARTKKFPDVPSIAESGWDAYEATAWYGFVVPKGTPKEIKAIGNTPEEFAAMMKAESARWADLVKEAAIKVE
jgi:tripartite-type tricarboxylate transporter receptor subunit TctC